MRNCFVTCSAVCVVFGESLFACILLLLSPPPPSTSFPGELHQPLPGFRFCAEFTAPPAAALIKPGTSFLLKGRVFKGEGGGEEANSLSQP